MKYRADIDGLRAIAVASIVIFHLSSGLLPGGFVGVDIFFVISGFLISKIVYADSANFSLSDFYVRRARRILPALIVVLILSSACAAWLFYPSELVEYAKSVVASSLFSANIYFFSALNYFSPNADEIPLLHLWSLGVEEQFYIFFPWIAAALFRRSERALKILLILVAGLSVVSSQWMLHANPSASFYLIPFRAFELLIGSMLALPNTKLVKSSKATAALFIAGAVAIGWSIFGYGGLTPFPGLAAVLPCAGAALIIYAGHSRQELLSRLLGSRPLVYLGKISYSLYLVHWPILVFGKRVFPHVEHVPFMTGALALSLILATLIYHFVEQPFRHARRPYKARTVLSISTASIFVVAALGGCVIEKAGFPENVDARSAKALAYLQYDLKPAWRSRVCFLDPDQNPSAMDFSSCLPHGKGKKVMLWGDSHAAMFDSGLQKTLAAKGYALGSMSGSACPPVKNYEIPTRPFCEAFNDIAFNTVVKMHPDFVVLAAEWLSVPPEMDQLDMTIRMLAARGIRVIVLGPSPYYKQPVPIIVADRIKAKKDDSSAPEELNRAYLDLTESYMQKRFSNRADVTYISVLAVTCPKYKCPLVTPDETPVHFDAAHLTAAGSDLFAKDLTPLILAR